GPMIMVCFAVVLVLGGGVRSISLAPNRGRTATLATASALLVAGAGYGVVFLGSDPGTQHQHGGESHHVREFAAEKAAEHELGTSLQDLQLGLRDSHAAVRAKAINELVSRNDRSAVPDIIDRLGDSSTAVRENAAKALGVLGDPAAIPALKRVMEVPGEDEWIRLQAAESVARLGDAAGLPLLLQLARHAEAGLARHEALEALVELSSLEMPEDAGASEKLDLLAAWLERNRTDLTWDPASGTFLPHAAAP
ncbi:MAG: HEAT repeat domain-containing protein, partial [Acidobacteriota bacterium]